MSPITIQADKCVHDGICVHVCPMGVIAQEGQESAKLVDGGEKRCFQCGQCIAVCPKQAIKFTVDQEALTLIDKDKAVDIEAAEQLMRSRRSIRNYKEKSVPRELYSRMIDTTRWAPTAMNSQNVHWTVIDSKEEVNRIITLTAEGMIQNNIMVQMAEAWDNGKGKDLILRGAP